MSHAQLLKLVLSRLIAATLVFTLLFFLPAGTWNYWQAWTYMGVLFIPMLFVLAYLLKHDPELLERRMRMREKRVEQKLILKVSYIFFILAYFLPGFDVRFGWSHVPAWGCLAADGLTLLGYGIIFRVFQINSYASRVIEINSGQKVIDTDLYAIVRHPLYVGAILMYAVAPLALGSYWAILPALLIIPIIIVRIVNEESALVKDLPGYIEYKQKTKYRLIPHIW